MRQTHKRLSFFLAALLIVSATSAAPYSVGMADESAVVYNTGVREVTVGYDAQRADAAPLDYKLFDDDGGYAIQLEDNAFFPYEVQFKSGGATSAEWFETPQSIVRVGGHAFRVLTERNDDTKLSQIGAWIGGEYVAARPGPKSFVGAPAQGASAQGAPSQGAPSQGASIQPHSLLPLDYFNVSLNLGQYDRFQIENVRVSAVLSGLAVGSGDKVVWARLNYGGQQIVGQADSIDLARAAIESGGSFTLELVVGSALQLDDKNTRYIVDVSTSIPPIVQSVEAYAESGGSRSRAFVDNGPIEQDGRQSVYFYLPGGAPARTYYIGVSLGQAYRGYAAKAVDGDYNTAAAALDAASGDPSLDVTGKLLDQPMQSAGAGFPISYDPDSGLAWNDFTLVFLENNAAIGFIRLSVDIGESGNDVAFAGLYNSAGAKASRNETVTLSGGAAVCTYTLQDQFPAGSMYYLRLLYTRNGASLASNRSYVTKAVAGHYDTLQQAANQQDIKDQLFPAGASAGSGYLANYSGNGVNFTVFAENDAYKITVKAVNMYMYTPLPNPGAPDAYFRVEGAAELNNAYVLPYSHDTYYDVGYQTVFYTDDVPLGSLTPVFWSAGGVGITASGSGASQTSGSSVHDFSGGPVQYTASAQNGAGIKNYWVTFVKKHVGGAKLFVNGANGANGDGGATREVCLTSIHGYAHDIFVANVGDEELTGLKATLSNARNVEIDRYWSVGGAGNDRLAAFASTVAKDYGELPNVAKIRLLPTGEGAISGTLSITADGQEPVVITLTGNAGDPALAAGAIPQAVKYVPYAAKILQNDKYDWNVVTMELLFGALPAGVAIRPNGELYGAPAEAGTFTFGVWMTNSDGRFASSYASYTLAVGDNTAANVDASTDAGYAVSTRVGVRIGTYDVVASVADHVFVSNGDIGEFADFWLNGQKLARDTDYAWAAGSTKITIKQQVFQSKASRTEENTIAAEFRAGGDANGDIRRAAQNFVMNVGGGAGGGGGGGGGSGGSSSTMDAFLWPQKAEFDKAGGGDITVTFSPSIYKLLDITNGQRTLRSGSDYALVGTNLTITAKYLATLAVGEQKLRLSMSGGGSPTLTVTVTDSAHPDSMPDLEQPTGPADADGARRVVAAPDPIVVTVKSFENVENGAMAAAIKEAVEKAQAAPGDPPIIIEITMAGSPLGMPQARFIVPLAAVKALADVGNASLRLDMGPVGTITLRHAALSSIAEQAGAGGGGAVGANGGGVVECSIARGENEATVSISANGAPLASIGGGILVSLPDFGGSGLIRLAREGIGDEAVGKAFAEGGTTYASLAGSGTVLPMDYDKAYADVDPDEWYYDAVHFVSSRELFLGVDEEQYLFAPDTNMSRAMLATVLHRLEGGGDAGPGAGFLDVPQDEWYFAGISWASGAGIVQGSGEGYFNPDSGITREQLAVMAFNYARYAGMGAVERGDVSRFADAGLTSTWADEAVRWAVGVALLQGDDEGLLTPAGNATRAEVATIVMRLVILLVG